MNKRTFLKTSSALAGGAMVCNLISCKPGVNENSLKNWAGNLTYNTSNVHYPKTVDEVQQVVKKCKQLRALGSRHSFNRIADSKENLVSVSETNKVVSLDKATNTITVEGGMKYGELAPYLNENG